MGFSIIAKTGVQQQIKIPISGREVIQPFTWYTCPAGKRAICKGMIQCTGRGAAANSDFNAAGTIMFSWTTAIAQTAGNDYLIVPRALSTFGGGQFALFEVELAAGEIIETTQNTGTNSEFNLWMEVLELPV